MSIVILYSFIPMHLLVGCVVGGLVGHRLCPDAGRQYGGFIGLLVGMFTASACALMLATTDHGGIPVDPNIEGCAGMHIGVVLSILMVVLADYIVRKVGRS